MIIDFYTHLISERVGKILLKGKYYGPGKQYGYPEENAEADKRLALMDKYGVDIQVLTQTSPVLLGYNAGEAAEICRLSNDDNYMLCKAYPNRFINVGIVSLLDVNGAIREMERCIKDLDTRGVTISSNQNGVGLDSRDYDPFYELLAEHDMPILIHPTHWESYPLADFDNGWRMMGVFGWPFDTTQAVWRMIFGGVFDRFPNLQVVTHHLGGMFPYFSQRAINHADGPLKGRCKHDFMYYWRTNLWGDTALSGARAALPCGYDFFGAARMLFATDFPFGPEKGEDHIRECLAAVTEMKIPAKEKKMIFADNAKKLLKIK